MERPRTLVRTVKRLFRKFQAAGVNEFQFLDWRPNTQSEGMDTSPTQRWSSLEEIIALSLMLVSCAPRRSSRETLASTLLLQSSPVRLLVLGPRDEPGNEVCVWEK